MTHALVVFSGGLDSILAVKILEEQNIKVTGVSFSSYFFDTKQAEKVAKQLGINLIIKNIAEAQLGTVKNPQYGHGSALNPCIDCHGLMFKIAGDLAELAGADKKFDLIATGEVLGQRSFSQNKDALKKVEKLTGRDILRPLSAKLLPKTSYEKQGLIDREKLLDISGKSRRRQLELVKKYQVKYFPSPAGGCRLTENEFGRKVKQLLENDGQERKLNKVDFKLLRMGRHYWLQQNIKHKMSIQELSTKDWQDPRTHVVLGKNYEENEQLKKSARSGDILIELKTVMGPTALVFGNTKNNLVKDKQLLNKVKKLILNRTKSKDENIENVEWIVSPKSKS